MKRCEHKTNNCSDRQVDMTTEREGEERQREKQVKRQEGEWKLTSTGGSEIDRVALKQLLKNICAH